MQKRGFTVVELVITITIMGILLTLAVVNLAASQVNARNSERAADIEALSAHLENYYRNVNPAIAQTGGSYPDTAAVASKTTLIAALPDLDPKSVYAPGTDQSGAISLIPATNSIQSAAGITPTPTIGQYVYQPLTSSGALCTAAATNDCRKFNLYYRVEGTDEVNLVTSKNQ